MNWIKSNPFAAGLAGITALVCGLLFLLSSMWGTNYKEAKARFDEAHELVAASEKLALYPDDNLSDGKRKALVDYAQSIDDMRNLFEIYRPGKMVNVSPQVFTDRLKLAHQEVTAAFEKTNCALPQDFLLGFELYSNQLARSEATATLLLQLEGIKHALISLAKANPEELLKVYREPVIEEIGETVYEPGPNDIARYFPFEIAFRGSESSVRDFLNSLGSKESQYYVVRCLKIMNELDTPPRVADAKFEPTAVISKEVVTPDESINVFESDSDDEVKADPATASGAPVQAEATSASPAGEKVSPAAATVKAVDSSRILAQVLGNEDVIVFVRFDLAKFLPAKELPKP